MKSAEPKLSSLYLETEIGWVRYLRSETGWGGWHNECLEYDVHCDGDPCEHPMFKIGTLLVEAGVAKQCDWLTNTSGDWAYRATIDRKPVIDALDPKNAAVKRTLDDTLRRLGYEGNLDGTL